MGPNEAPGSATCAATISGSRDAANHAATDAPAPDYKLYVHSARFSHQDAAALFGVMWQAARKRDLAHQH